MASRWVAIALSLDGTAHVNVNCSPSSTEHPDLVTLLVPRVSPLTISWSRVTTRHHLFFFYKRICLLWCGKESLSCFCSRTSTTPTGGDRLTLLHVSTIMLYYILWLVSQHVQWWWRKELLSAWKKVQGSGDAYSWM